MTSTASKFIAAISDYADGDFGPRELCLSCLDVLPVDRAAVTISVAATGWEPLAASDDTAAYIEAQQAITGEGPAVDALKRGGPVLVDDLSTLHDRWPGFSEALGRDARGAMYAMPLQIGAIAVGVLDLYRMVPSSPSPADLTEMLAVADVVTVVLLSRKPSVNGAASTVDMWWTPSPTSREIHQATGMVVAQLQVPPAVAYLRLRAYAFTQGKQLNEVAHEVIGRTLRFEQEDEH